MYLLSIADNLNYEQERIRELTSASRAADRGSLMH